MKRLSFADNAVFLQPAIGLVGNSALNHAGVKGRIKYLLEVDVVPCETEHLATAHARYEPYAHCHDAAQVMQPTECVAQAGDAVVFTVLAAALLVHSAGRPN